MNLKGVFLAVTVGALWQSVDHVRGDDITVSGTVVPAAGPKRTLVSVSNGIEKDGDISDEHGRYSVTIKGRADQPLSLSFQSVGAYAKFNGLAGDKDQVLHVTPLRLSAKDGDSFDLLERQAVLVEQMYRAAAEVPNRQQDEFRKQMKKNTEAWRHSWQKAAGNKSIENGVGDVLKRTQDRIEIIQRKRKRKKSPE